MRKFLRGLSIGILIGMMVLALPGAAESINKTISVYLNHVNIQVNGEEIASDNFLYNGTTYIPLREVSEILGKDVDFDNTTKTVFITETSTPDTNNPDTSTPDTTPDTTEPDTTPDTSEPDTTPDTSEPDTTEPDTTEPDTTPPDNPEPVVSSNAINGAEVGMTENELIISLGSPNRKDPSAYGFTWYIYNSDYTNYVQVGVKDSKVVAVYSNIGNWKLDKKVSIGSTESTVKSAFGDRLSKVTEGYYSYSLSGSSNNVVYNYSDDNYIYIFYDKHNNYTVTGAMIWSKTIPFRDMYYGNYKNIDTKLWSDAMEKQLLDTSNTFRVRMGLKAFTTDDKINKSAYLHSYDMSQNNYFSHTNLQGQSPFDRMKDQGIKYSRAGENIAYGQRNAIFANHGLMNSEGHRKNILGSYTRLGTGVHFNTSRNQAYYTQNFYTPSNYN